MALTEERRDAQRETDKHKRDAGRFREESGKTTGAPHREAEIAYGGDQRHQNHQSSAGRDPFPARRTSVRHDKPDRGAIWRV
jgi:hypothetical protein